MSAKTTLAFQDKMTKQLASIMKYLDEMLYAFDDLEDVATEFEHALDAIDHSSLDLVERSMDDVVDQTERAIKEMKELDRAADSIDSSDIGRLERALRDAAKAGDEAAEKLEYLDSAAGHLEEIGGIATVGGAVITAGLTVAGSAAYDMEHSLGMLQARVGATDEQMVSMRSSVENLFTSGILDSFQEATESFGRFRHLLKGTDEEIEKVAAGAIALEKISLGDLDQDSIVRALNMMQDQFGTGPVKGLDMISSAYQRVGDQADDLLDTIWEYSPQFKEAGISAEKMMGMFVSGMESGAFNFDKLGDVFKESFGIRLNKALDENALQALEPIFGESKLFDMLDQIKAGGKEAENAIMAITAGIASIKDQGLQDDILSNVFGTQYEDVGREALMSMMQAGPLEDFAGKSQEIFDQTKSEWQAMANDMQLAFKPVGDSVLEVIKPVAGFIADMVTSIGEFGKEHPFITKVAVSLLMVVSVILMVIGPLLLLMGLMQPLTAGFFALRGAMAGFGLSSLAALWPILAIIAAVTALIAVGWWLYDNWDTVSAYLISAWEWLKSAGIAVWDGLTSYLKMMFNFWKGMFKFFLQYLNGDWEDAFETLKSTFIGAFNTIDGWLGGWISRQFDTGRKIITTIVNGILSVKNKIGEAIQSAFEWADRFLPHSDAEVGPFSRLTDSGMAIPETMALGIADSTDSLIGAFERSFSRVPVSLDANRINNAGTSSRGSNSPYVNYKPTIQISVNAQDIGSDGDRSKLVQEIVEELAQELEHYFSGTGSIVIE